MSRMQLCTNHRCYPFPQTINLPPEKKNMFGRRSGSLCFRTLSNDSVSAVHMRGASKRKQSINQSINQPTNQPINQSNKSTPQHLLLQGRHVVLQLWLWYLNDTKKPLQRFHLYTTNVSMASLGFTIPRGFMDTSRRWRPGGRLVGVKYR